MKNKINEDNLSQRNLSGYPKNETINQLENVFVLVFETYGDQKIAEEYVARLNNVNRSRDNWLGSLTPERIETQRENVIVFEKSGGNPIMNMLLFIPENYGEDERTFFQ